MIDPNPPSIRFGLPEEAYHADPSCSSSGIKNVLVSPLTAWARSPMNPAYDDSPTPAKLFGKAYHKRLVEGAEAFAAEYYRSLERADWPEALETAEDLKRRCRDLELPVGGTKADLAGRILEVDPEAEIWDDIVAKHMMANDGKSVLKAGDWDEIGRAAALVDAHADAGRALSGGWPEVSVFWTDPEFGVPCKARFDRLKMRAVTDLKTFANVNDRPVDAAITHAIANYRYHVQAAFYLRGVAAAKALFAARGMDVVALPDGAPQAMRAEVEAFLNGFAAEPEHRFFFVFQEKGEAPNVRVREFARRAADGAETLYWADAQAKMRDGMSLWRRCLETFGTEKPWAPPDPLRAFADEEFPLWMTGS